MLETLFAITLFVFLGYVFFIWNRYGVLTSISESYYLLPDKLKFLFVLFCWGFSIPVIMLAHNPLIFFAGSGIAFVGAAAQFKKKLSKEVHTLGAFSGVLFSQLSIFLDFNLLYVNILFMVGSLLLFLTRNKFSKNYIWWIEILAFLSILYTLGLSLI